MRRIRYAVATSLDGYIAGPNGETDWIVKDPTIDFRAIYQQFDTLLVGRRTFEAAPSAFRIPGMQTFVLSRTLRQGDYPGVTVIGETCEEALTALRAKESEKDIWLFGGGLLFRSLLDAKLVDVVEVAISPVLLGGGIPLLASPANQVKLKLIGHKLYQTGIVALEYAAE